MKNRKDNMKQGKLKPLQMRRLTVDDTAQYNALASLCVPSDGQ